MSQAQASDVRNGRGTFLKVTKEDAIDRVVNFGHPIAEVARSIGADPSTVSTWVKKHRAGSDKQIRSAKEVPVKVKAKKSKSDKIKKKILDESQAKTESSNKPGLMGSDLPGYMFSNGSIIDVPVPTTMAEPSKEDVINQLTKALARTADVNHQLMYERQTLREAFRILIGGNSSLGTSGQPY